MNLLFRMLWTVVASLFRSRSGLLDSSGLRFRVLPTDLDINMHMTNARYLSFMDLGRTDLMLRVGLLSTVWRKRWMPVVGHVDIKFLRSLQPFQRFTLTSRLLCWDAKWLYLEQRVESTRGLHSVAYVRGLLRENAGAVPTERVLAEIGYQEPSPQFPPELAHWTAAVTGA